MAWLLLFICLPDGDVTVFRMPYRCRLGRPEYEPRHDDEGFELIIVRAGFGRLEYERVLARGQKICRYPAPHEHRAQAHRGFGWVVE